MSKKISDSIRKNKFLSLASEAAWLERHFSFGDAANIWREALIYSVSSANKFWCEKRIEICEFRFKFNR